MMLAGKVAGVSDSGLQETESYFRLASLFGLRFPLPPTTCVSHIETKGRKCACVRVCVIAHRALMPSNELVSFYWVIFVVI